MSDSKPVLWLPNPYTPLTITRRSPTRLRSEAEKSPI